jgi:hypothetical protein
MQKFIFNGTNINEFYQKIKKLFSNTQTLTEETDFDDKNNNNLNILNKGYDENNIFQNQMEFDNNQSLFSEED